MHVLIWVYVHECSLKKLLLCACYDLLPSIVAAPTGSECVHGFCDLILENQLILEHNEIHEITTVTSAKELPKFGNIFLVV